MLTTETTPKTSSIPIRRRDAWPITPFRSMFKDMRRLMDDFGGLETLPSLDLERLAEFSPNIDMVETENEVKVSADLPGIEEKNIEVSLANSMLTIKGEKKSEKEEKNKNYYYMERSSGSFTRSLQLPCEVDRDKVVAMYQKGVLTVTLPKTAKAKSECRQIPVKGA